MKDFVEEKRSVLDHRVMWSADIPRSFSNSKEYLRYLADELIGTEAFTTKELLELHRGILHHFSELPFTEATLERNLRRMASEGEFTTFTCPVSSKRKYRPNRDFQSFEDCGSLQENEYETFEEELQALLEDFEIAPLSKTMTKFLTVLHKVLGKILF